MIRNLMPGKPVFFETRGVRIVFFAVDTEKIILNPK